MSLGSTCAFLVTLHIPWSSEVASHWECPGFSPIKPWTFTGGARGMFRVEVLSTGDVSHIVVPGQHIVVLNSVEAAMYMLDNKSTIYYVCPIFLLVANSLAGKSILLLKPPSGYPSRCYWLCLIS
ncbi:hypothetical protein BDR07DRAFT_1425707 [Suillus spraguei]|nr:hypothetical protein BDR07DRAFT_1425707 [Suillus spraguei]